MKFTTKKLVPNQQEFKVTFNYNLLILHRIEESLRKITTFSMDHIIIRAQCMNKVYLSLTKIRSPLLRGKFSPK